MTLAVRFLVSALWLLLLLQPKAGNASPDPVAGTQSATAVPSSSAQGIEKLTAQEGLLSVTAKDANLRLLLEALGEKAGVAIHVDRGVQGKVSVEFTNKTLQDALGIILGQVDGANYLTGYGGGEKVKEVWILPKGADASVADEDLRLRRFDEEDKSYLQEKYGSLARAVPEVLGRKLSGKPWQAAEWKSFPGRPDWLSGEISLGQDIVGSEETALAYGLEFMETYENVLQTRTKDLTLNARRTERYPEAYRFVFDQVYEGRPVEGAVAGLTVSKGRLTLSNHTFPGIDVDPQPKLSPEEAVRLAEAEHRRTFPSWRFGSPGATYDDIEDAQRRPTEPPQLLIVPKSDNVQTPSNYDYYLAYKVRSRA